MKQVLDKIKNWKYLPVVLIVLLCLAFACAMLSDKKATVYTEEEKLEQLLSKIEGVGKLSLFINDTDDKSVVVVCEGANNIRVRIELLDAVATALSIPKQNISICEMK